MIGAIEVLSYLDALAVNPLAALSTILDILKSGVSTVQGGLVGAAKGILGACVAIVIGKAWLETILEADAMGFITSVLETIVIGTVVLMVITNISAIDGFAWGLCDKAMSLFAMGGGGGTTGGIIDTLWGQVVDIAAKILAFYTGDPAQASCDGGFFCTLSNAISATIDTLIVWQTVLFVILLLLIYMAIMLFQVFRGLFQIAVGLMWLPLAAAFYPLIDSWSKSAVSVIAGGIAHMAAVSFLLGLVGKASESLLENMQAGTLPGIDGIQMMPKTWGVMVICITLIILAFCAGTAISKSAEIFGTSSGMMHIHRKSGGGGGGNSKGSGGSGGGGGDSALAAATSPAAAAENPAGAAIQAGGQVAAGVATGGASTAASAAGVAAGTAAKAGAGTAAKAGGGLAARTAGAIGRARTAGQQATAAAARGGAGFDAARNAGRAATARSLAGSAGRAMKRTLPGFGAAGGKSGAAAGAKKPDRIAAAVGRAGVAGQQAAMTAQRLGAGPRLANAAGAIVAARAVAGSGVRSTGRGFAAVGGAAGSIAKANLVAGKKMAGFMVHSAQHN